MASFINKDIIIWKIGEAKYRIVCCFRNVYAANRRKHLQKHWKRKVNGRLNEGGVLSETQKQEAYVFFLNNTGKRISTKFHEFYAQKTGRFDSKIIPDDIYYSYVDQFFNDWNMVKYIDNKCYYHRLFLGIAQPKTIAMRMGNLWLIPDENRDGSFKYVDKETVIGIVSSHNSVMKQATESEGGHGVFFLPASSAREAIIAAIDRLNNLPEIARKWAQ